MIRLYIHILAFLAITGATAGASAQSAAASPDFLISPAAGDFSESGTNTSPYGSFPRSYIGIHTGLDIGGSAPIPAGKLGKNAKINVAPGLMPQLGGSWAFMIDDRWSVGAEVTYKSVDLDIKAWVPGQRYRDKDNEGLFVTFRGTTRIKMSYSMLEVPLYAGYTFGPLRNNTFILGFYYAYMLKHDFKVFPTKGTITSSTGTIGIITPDSPYTQDFNGDLKNWDWGFTAGYSRKIMNRLDLGVRFSMGLTDVFRNGSNALDYSMYQIRGTLMLSYRIFKLEHSGR